jgi:hypothetical protein
MEYGEVVAVLERAKEAPQQYVPRSAMTDGLNRVFQNHVFNEVVYELDHFTRLN